MLVTLLRRRFNGRICSTPPALKMPLPPWLAASPMPAAIGCSVWLWWVRASTVSHLRRPVYVTIDCDFSWCRLLALPSRRIMCRSFCCTTFSELLDPLMLSRLPCPLTNCCPDGSRSTTSCSEGVRVMRISGEAGLWLVDSRRDSLSRSRSLARLLLPLLALRPTSDLRKFSMRRRRGSCPLDNPSELSTSPDPPAPAVAAVPPPPFPSELADSEWDAGGSEREMRVGSCGCWVWTCAFRSIPASLDADEMMLILLRVCVSSSATVSFVSESCCVAACEALPLCWLLARCWCFVLARLWIGEESCRRQRRWSWSIVSHNPPSYSLLSCFFNTYPTLLKLFPCALLFHLQYESSRKLLILCL